MNLQQIRQAYPQYRNISDVQLAEGLHRKFYPDMPYEDFAQRIGAPPSPSVYKAVQKAGKTAEVIAEQLKTKKFNAKELAGMFTNAGKSPDTAKQLSEALVSKSSFEKLEQMDIGSLEQNFTRDVWSIENRVSPEQAKEAAELLYDENLAISDQIADPSAPFKTPEGPAKQPLTPDEKENAIKQRVKLYISDKADEIHESIQAPYDQKIYMDHLNEYEGKFLKKSYLRWERGAVMVGGGGLHLFSQLEQAVTGGKYGESADELARMYHNALKLPEMQPVIEHWMDKYLGGAVETAPFMLAAMPVAIGTGGAAIPTGVASYLTAYAVEGNMAYQLAKDRGLSETEARERGFVTGMINGGIEIAGGGAGKYFRYSAIRKITTKLGKVKFLTKSLLRNAIREGCAEELPQEIVQMVMGGDVPRYKNGSVDWDQVASRLVDTTISGTIIGGIMSGPGVFGRAVAMHEMNAMVEKPSLEPITEERISYHPDAIKNIVAAHNEHGGSTINLITGEPITKGFAVAIPESVEETINSDKITEKQIEDYRNKHADILNRDIFNKDKNITVGTWVEKGKSILDISTVIDNEQKALDIARKSNQKAVFNLETLKDISAISKEKPVTADEAIGEEYGLTPSETREQLAIAERRYRQLKHKDSRTKKEQAEIKFLKHNRTNIESLIAERTDPVSKIFPTVGKKTINLLKQGHSIPDKLGWTENQRRDFNELITGKRSMSNMTSAEREFIVKALKAKLDGKTKHVFHKATTLSLATPQIRYAIKLGVDFIVHPAATAKIELDMEEQIIRNHVDQQLNLINKLGGETIASKARAKLKNKPTASVRTFSKLLDKYEEAPDFLSSEQKGVFTFFRELNREIIRRENENRVKLGMKEIPYRKAFVRHIADQIAMYSLNDLNRVPEDLRYIAEKSTGRKIFNPMEFQRVLSDELTDAMEHDLGKLTKAMVHTGLREIYLNAPLQFAKQQLGVYAKDIPVSTRNWIDNYLKTTIRGEQSDIDARANNLLTNKNVKRVMNTILRPFGRTLSDRPLTNALVKAGRLQIYGVLGFRPKQLIRNKFQLIQNTALFGPEACIKAFVPAKGTLRELMDESLFLRSYTGMEEMPVGTMRKLGKIWMAAFQRTAVGNARTAFKAAFHSYKRLIVDPAYKEYGWADPRRTYTEADDFFYDTELKTLKDEMTLAAQTTQYQYLGVAMPGIFAHKALTPVTRLQSWWLNHWFGFHAEAARRFFIGKTLTGQRLPLSHRLNYLTYLTLGQVVLKTLGYGTSLAFGAVPAGLPPFAEALFQLIRWGKGLMIGDDKLRKSGQRRFWNAAKTFLPGYFAFKDVAALLSGKNNLTKFLFYGHGLWENKKEDDEMFQKMKWVTE